MLSVEEMSAWNTREIKGEIERLLPKGWHFQQGWDGDDQMWFARFFRFRQEPDPIVEWEDWHADERINLFNAYGQLWLETRPKPPADSPWNRRRELTQEFVAQKALELADPADLDPVEVRAVYESVRGKK